MDSGVFGLLFLLDLNRLHYYQTFRQRTSAYEYQKIKRKALTREYLGISM